MILKYTRLKQIFYFSGIERENKSVIAIDHLCETTDVYEVFIFLQSNVASQVRDGEAKLFHVLGLCCDFLKLSCEVDSVLKRANGRFIRNYSKKDLVRRF